MFARIVKYLAAVAIAAIAASCSPAPPVSAPTRASAPLPEKVQAGEKFEIKDPQGRTMVRASIDAVRVDPGCTANRQDASQRDEHYVAVLMSFDTTDKYRNAGVDLTGPPTTADFRLVGPYGRVDETVRPLRDNQCAGEEKVFRTDLRPAAQYQGWVFLQTEFAKGTMYYRPQGALSLPGWEITFPAGEAAPPAVGEEPSKGHGG